MSLNAIATPAAREPGPLVTRCRSRTVAKVDSIGLVVRRCTQMLGRVVIEGEQHVEVLGDFGDRLGPLGAVEVRECLSRLTCVFLVLGVVDLSQRRLRARVR